MSNFPMSPPTGLRGQRRSGAQEPGYRVTVTTQGERDTNRYESAQERDERLAWEAEERQLSVPFSGSTQHYHSLCRRKRQDSLSGSSSLTADDGNDSVDPQLDDNCRASPSQAEFYDLSADRANNSINQEQALQPIDIDGQQTDLGVGNSVEEWEQEDDYEDIPSQEQLVPISGLSDSEASQRVMTFGPLPSPVQPLSWNQSADPLSHLSRLNAQMMVPLPPPTSAIQHPRSLVFSLHRQRQHRSQVGLLEPTHRSSEEDDNMKPPGTDPAW
ncbi:hypothetical protein TREMEDRAFT_60783 [Tremella mesenterica DSM 1558]|uniref:uncharacterized protein n=1 Tax=Tremella mesenterica (strain ATCC 24925 / CBS 8224 / DSM 1558 / NBRC 9311 / NRRL Y-6157 / RJB 2259-6 / UBC 559-6) TaxID=578456 RepID=UPI0003F49C89|nr:uncharacterized protein TREMEDRAFT_60783 [Tremella mesenterica DSM 1558]EIW71860.1 hypothetical protein TREMEDRAFT_60783 [Tremella mesenterica DSM 1558]